jgi:LysR family transcriptional regulator, low CO2-responsive transcriptional regulator
MSYSRIRRYLKHGTLPQIAVFEAIARLGSYTRAAAELHLAQPTVSTQIKKLTDSVGLPLFEQVGKRVYLTDAGRTLYAACGEIFAAFGRVEQKFAELRGVEAGRLRLAVGTSASFMPGLLARFARRYPGVEISLRFCNRAELSRRLADNEDDLYVFSTPPEQEVVKQALLPNSLVACAPADHPLAQQPCIPLERLVQEPFLLREPGSGTRTATEQLFERRGVWPEIRMELSSDAAICQAVGEGLGVSIVSQHALPARNNGDIVTLDVDGLPLLQQWYFVYPAGKQLSQVAQALIALERMPEVSFTPAPAPAPRPAYAMERTLETVVSYEIANERVS